MRALPDVIMPFPGGIVRSGSKVGIKYQALGASTNDAYCPTLKAWSRRAADARTRCVLEIVIDGLTEADVGAAMRVGMQAGIALGAERRHCCASRPATTAASSASSDFRYTYFRVSRCVRMKS